MKDIIQMDVETHSMTGLIWTPADNMRLETLSQQIFGYGQKVRDTRMPLLLIHTEQLEHKRAQENKAILVLISI